MSENVSTEIYAPYYKVVIDGNLLAPAAVLAVSVDLKLDAPDKFDITLNEGLEIETQQFTWLDNEILNPGKNAEVYFGYAGGARHCLIKGSINALSPAFPSTGVPTLTVEGYDYSKKLQSKINTFNTTDVKYSDIASEIAGKHGLGAGGVENSGVAYPQVDRRQGENDYNLLKRLAGELNFEFFVRTQTLYFREPKESTVIKTFTFRKDLISFTPRLTTGSLVTRTKATGWNPITREAVEGTATIAQVATEPGISRILAKFVGESQGNQPKQVEIKVNVDTIAEAARRARLELVRLIYTFIQGDIECVGDPALIPGSSVEIRGIGEIFSGKYYITGAKHSFGSGGYTTSLSVRRAV